MEKLPDPGKLRQEFILDAFADPTSVRDVVRGILHTIFFHRYFPTLAPQTHEVLDLTLPYVAVPELETLIDQRTATLIQELDSASSTPAAGQSPAASPQAHHHHYHHHNVHVHHASLPKQPSQPGGRLGAVVGGFLGGAGASAPGNVAAMAGATSAGGGRGQVSVQFMEKTTAKRRKMWYKGDEEVCWETWTVRVTVAEPRTESERAKVRKAMESTLLTTVMKIISSVNTYKDHIPPITTTEANPFPYSINVNHKDVGLGGWGGRFGGLY